MRVRVNGEFRDAAGRVPVSDFLREIGAPLDRVAVELNREIVRKRDWDCTMVEDGAQLEIVEFVGGG